MLALKNFSKASQCFSLATKITGQQRTLFAPSFFGVDKFKTHLAKTQHTQRNNKENVKSIIQQAVDTKDSQVFTEDLKLMMYLTETNEELELLVKAIRKYDGQVDSEFSFGAPLVRLAYTMNETDKMLELFLNDTSKAFNENRAGTILMNKLFEEKRYNDCISLFRKQWADLKGKEKTRPDGSVRQVFSYNYSTSILAEALLEKNDCEALKVAKEIFTDLNSNKIVNSKNPYVVIWLLASQQKDFQYANEVLENLVSHYPEFFKSHAMHQNIQVINLCNLDKVPEAIICANQMLRNNYQHKFTESTIEILKEASIRTGDSDIMKTVEDIIDQASGSMIVKSIRDHFLNLQTISPQDANKLRMSEQQDGGHFRTRENYGDRNERNSFTRPRSSFTSPRENFGDRNEKNPFAKPRR